MSKCATLHKKKFFLESFTDSNKTKCTFFKILTSSIYICINKKLYQMEFQLVQSSLVQILILSCFVLFFYSICVTACWRMINDTTVFSCHEQNKYKRLIYLLSVKNKNKQPSWWWHDWVTVWSLACSPLWCIYIIAREITAVRFLQKLISFENQVLLTNSTCSTDKP